MPTVLWEVACYLLIHGYTGSSDCVDLFICRCLSLPQMADLNSLVTRLEAVATRLEGGAGGKGGGAPGGSGKDDGGGMVGGGRMESRQTYCVPTKAAPTIES